MLQYLIGILFPNFQKEEEKVIKNSISIYIVIEENNLKALVWEKLLVVVLILLSFPDLIEIWHATFYHTAQCNK